MEARQAAVSGSDFFARDRAEAEADLAALADLQATLEARIERWMELEALATGRARRQQAGLRLERKSARWA